MKPFGIDYMSMWGLGLAFSILSLVWAGIGTALGLGKTVCFLPIAVTISIYLIIMAIYIIGEIIGDIKKQKKKK